MSYGIKTYGDDGYINLHSDYSSLVYVGEMTQSVAPTQLIYTGDYSQTITSSRLNSNYDMGFIMQFQYAANYSYVLPFYIPNFDGQEIAIMDQINENGVWKVNVLFNGSSGAKPQLFLFAPITEISNVSQNSHGLTVWDSSGKIVFTDKQRPLRVDDVVTITHPTTIRNGAKGSCGNDPSCDVQFTPDQSITHTGSVNNDRTKMYHVVTSTYGGLAFDNNGTYTTKCGFFNLGRKKHAWGYASWDSFRGTIKHPRNGATHVASWAGDFCGKVYQLASGSCGYGGFLGFLIGVIGVVLAPVTGGASLGLIAVAGLTGFVVGEIVFAPSTPSIRSYTADQVLDVNNSVNMIMTDADYYGITVNSSTFDEPTVLSYQFSTAAGVPEYYWADLGGSAYIVWNGTVVSTGTISSGTTSYTASDGHTYYRASTVSYITEVISGVYFYYYGVARA